MKNVTVLLISVLMLSCMSANQTQDEVLNDGQKCSIISQDFVLQHVKFPDETTFEERQYVHERDGQNAVILNKFTTKNGFGVKVSCVYKIWLDFKGGEWTDINNWSYTKMTIEGSDGSFDTFYY